ncbi:MAG: hypothetical protein LBG43_01425 [Treponema sp.]|nr:hypothetical protein [Treponema sp.]
MSINITLVSFIAAIPSAFDPPHIELSRGGAAAFPHSISRLLSVCFRQDALIHRSGGGNWLK